MYALVSHSDGSSGPDGMPQPMRGPKAEDKDKEVAFVFTDIESSTELSNQDGDAFKQVSRLWWRCWAHAETIPVCWLAAMDCPNQLKPQQTTQPASTHIPIMCLLPAAARGA